MAVDIIVPTMNRPVPLERSLKSAVMNAGHPIRGIIIVDSSDSKRHQEVLTVVSKLRDLLGIPIRVAHQPPKGPSAAMNMGIRLSKSKFIVRIDDDIICGKNWLKKIMEVFQKDEKIGCCFARVLPMKKDFRSKIYTVALSMDKGDKTYIISAKDLSVFSIIRSIRDYIKWRLSKGTSKGLTPPPFVGYIIQAFRRRAIFSIGLYDENLSVGTPSGGGEEPDLAYRMLRRGWKVAYVGESVVYHECSRRLNVLIRDAFEAGTSKRALVEKYVREGDLYMLFLGFLILVNLTLEYLLIRPRTPLGKALKLLKAMELYGYIKGRYRPVKR